MIKLSSNMMKKKQSGSITPFLTFVLILMLAMLGTLLEAARVQTGKEIAKETLNTAVESQLSQFYLPLYEDYHLFFMERGIDTEQLEQKELLESIREYMLYTFDAEKGLAGDSLHLYSDFYDLQIQKTEIKKMVRAVENNGNLLRTQAIEYSKYNSAEEVLELFSKQMDAVKGNQKASEIVAKKLETEECLSEVSSKILEIMELVEGVSCNKKKTALAFTNSGDLKSEKEFAKKFCPDTVTAVHAGVDCQVVWNLLKDKYQTPVTTLKEVKKSMDRIEEDIAKMEQLSKETEQLKENVSGAKENIQKIKEQKAQEQQTFETLKQEKERLEKELKEQTSEGTVEEELLNSIEQIKKEMKKSKEKIKTLSDNSDAVQESIDKSLEEEQKKSKQKEQMKQQQKDSLKKINASIQSLAKQAEAVRKQAQKAVDVIPQLEEKQSRTQGKLKEYRTLLSQSEQDLTEELKNGMKEDLEQLEQYVAKENGKNSYVTRIQNMKPVLEKNIKILKQLSAMSDRKLSLDHLENWKNEKNKIDQLIKSFEGYHIDTLKFDYRTLNVKKDTKDPIDSMSSALSGDVLELVLPAKVTVSDKKIANADAYHKHYAKSNGSRETQTEMDYQKSLKNSKKDGYQSEITDSFGSYGKAEKGLKEGTQALLEKMLFQQYCNTHFKGFTDVIEKNKAPTAQVSLSKEEIKMQDGDTVLDYEQEYLLAGKAKDKDNLKAAVNKIIFIRTVSNFMYLMTDGAKKKTAYATAAALVGFSGMEPLVRLTQTTILLTWAYEEALVDTGALLAGKSIPFMKDKTTFLLQYQEMFCISKALIQKKVQMVRESKTALAMKYKDYIQIFFMLEEDSKKSYRAMDLIEGNLRKRNNQQFTFSRAVYGMDVSAEVSMKSKFLHLPSVQDFTKWKGKGWKFSISQSHSY